MRRTRSEIVAAICQAIAEEEGYFKPGTKEILHENRAARNKNPGNLRKWGNVCRVDGYACFPYDEAFFAGQRDEKGELRPGGYAGWAPAADGNRPLKYAQDVALRAALDIDIPIEDQVDR